MEMAIFGSPYGPPFMGSKQPLRASTALMLLAMLLTPILLNYIV